MKQARIYMKQAIIYMYKAIINMCEAIINAIINLLNQFKQEVLKVWGRMIRAYHQILETYKRDKAIREEQNRIKREKVREVDDYLRGNRVSLPNRKVLNEFRTLHLNRQGELFIREVDRYIGPYTIVDSEYVPDVNQVTKKGGWVGRTIAGGLIAGPAGAVIGAVTRKKKTKTTDNSVILIKVRNTATGEKNTLAVSCTSSEYIRWRQILEGLSHRPIT